MSIDMIVVKYHPSAKDPNRVGGIERFIEPIIKALYDTQIVAMPKGKALETPKLIIMAGGNDDLASQLSTAIGNGYMNEAVAVEFTDLSIKPVENAAAVITDVIEKRRQFREEQERLAVQRREDMEREALANPPQEPDYDSTSVEFDAVMGNRHDQERGFSW